MQQGARTTVVIVNDQNYQVRRMTAAVGSYIWQLLMAACFKARQSMPDDVAEESSVKTEEEKSAEEKLRGLCGIAFMHLDFKDYNADRQEILIRMKEKGVGAITIGADLESSKKAVEIAEANENIFACIGIHPEYSTSPEKSDNTVSALGLKDKALETTLLCFFAIMNLYDFFKT